MKGHIVSSSDVAKKQLLASAQSSQKVKCELHSLV